MTRTLGETAIGAGIDNQVVVRAVAPDDWRGILAIERARYGDHGYDVTFVRMIPLLFARTCWVAATAGGAVAGYALGVVVDGEPELAWILSVAVAVDGGGVGRRLTETCIAGLEAVGARRVRLTVAPDNHRARRLYERLGFVALKLEPDFFGPHEDRVLMER